MQDPKNSWWAKLDEVTIALKRLTLAVQKEGKKLTVLQAEKREIITVQV